MDNNRDFNVASFIAFSDTINIDRGDGTQRKTVHIPGRGWRRACCNSKIMVATSWGQSNGACIFTSAGDLTQAIETQQGIRSCALSRDGQHLILGSEDGTRALCLFLFESNAFYLILFQVYCPVSCLSAKNSSRIGTNKCTRAVFARYRFTQKGFVLFLQMMRSTMKQKSGQSKVFAVSILDAST